MSNQQLPPETGKPAQSAPAPTEPAQLAEPDAASNPLDLSAATPAPGAASSGPMAFGTPQAFGATAASPASSGPTAASPAQASGAPTPYVPSSPYDPPQTFGAPQAFGPPQQFGAPMASGAPQAFGPAQPHNAPPPTGPAVPYGSPPAAPARRGGDGFFDSIRRIGIYRSPQRWFGGVAGGVAERLGIDPLIVRGVLFISTFLGGFGLILYGLGWALLPERTDGRIHLQEAIRGHFDVAMAGAIAMFVIGCGWGNGWAGRVAGGLWGWFVGLVWLAIVVGVGWFVVRAISRKRAKPKPVPPAAWAAPTPPPGWSASAPPPGWPAAQPTSTPYAASPAGSGPADPKAEAGGAAIPATVSTSPWETTMTAPTYGTATTSYPAAPYPAPAYSAPAYSAPSAPAYPAPSGTMPNPTSGKPPKPPKPRRPGPGSALVGGVVGLILLAGAGLLLGDHAGRLVWPVGVTWAAAALISTGLGIVIAGLLGRRAGILTLIAILTAAIWVPVAAGTEWGTRHQFVASETVVPVDPGAAEGGYSFAFGDTTLDLRTLDLSGASATFPATVPVSLGAGQLRIIVPQLVPLRADVRLGAGEVQWNVEGENQSTSGVHSGTATTFMNREVAGGVSPVLILKIDVGAGTVIVEDRSS